MNTLKSHVWLAAGAVIWASAAVASPRSAVFGHARFTPLTDRIVRCEWSEDGTFEDRPSLVFVNRETPAVEWTCEANGQGATIKTAFVTLEWSGGAFNATNLIVNGIAALADDDENLLGTRRTLDAKTSFEDILPGMEKGLLSRRGVTAIDDTATPLFEDGWVVERPRRAGYCDVAILAYGHDYKACLGDWTLVSGKIPLPPRWAFGYWWSRYWLYTDREVRDLVDTFVSLDIPIDVFILDMEWHETWGIGARKDAKDEFGQLWGWTGYTWNRRLFPDPESTLGYLHKRGCKVALNLHPASGIQPVENCYADFARDYGWKGTNGIPFRAEDKKWCDCYFKNVIAPLERGGVDFWWLDWQQWKNSVTMPSLNNTFWLNHVFFEGSRVGRAPSGSSQRDGGPCPPLAARTSKSLRPFIYHRWGGLGSHRYQVGFSGDCKVSWSMLAALPWFTATASNVCYGYWGHDIGGHMDPDGDDGKDGELFTRWLQSGVFTPIFKTHCTKDATIERRIWKYPDHFLALREALRLRYRLAPYIYTAAREAYDTGVSICRPMYYDWPEEDMAYAVRNQYMFGDDILSVTITNVMAKGETSSKVDVWLPEGSWFDVSAGELLEGARTVRREYEMDENPWFVKAGAIIPMYPAGVRNLANPGTDDLELFFAPFPHASQAHGSDACEFMTSVYEDEGDNADYATSYSRTTVVRNGGRIVIGPRRGAYTLRFPLLSSPARVFVNGMAHDWEWDERDFAVVVRTPRQDGVNETVVEMEFDGDMYEESLNGLKGRQRRIDAVSEDFKSALRPIHWALNVPDSWQTLWQIPSAISSSPFDMPALLDRRDEALRKFLDCDLPVLAPKLPQELVSRLREVR